MIILEGYNYALKNFGKELTDKLCSYGIPKNFIYTACKFYKEYGVPIETLQDDFKKWNRYILHNPQYKGCKDLNSFSNYNEFKSVINNATQPYICPNPIFDDGNLSIGECKTQKDARWFPFQNLANPEENNDFCICKNRGGYLQFQKYKNQGYKILLIYDKSKEATDEYKRLVAIARDGFLFFWNNYDAPCGTTKHSNSPIWNYIDSLPNEAQLALSTFAESTLSENKQYKTNRNMKQVIRLTESDLHRVIKESVKKILKENDFTPHGYKATSAFGGYEVQLDDRGENARLRNSYDGTITDWLEIQFDENGVAYVIDENGEEERLCDYMRY